MTPKPKKLNFPLWDYLNQPLFDAQRPIILNPQQFWRFHQVQYLERCWSRRFRPEEHFHS